MSETLSLSRTPVLQQVLDAGQQFERQGAPFYRRLMSFSRDMVLPLADEARIPPKPHLLLAVARYLFLQSDESADGRYAAFPSLASGFLAGDAPSVIDDALLREEWLRFCDQEYDNIRELLQTRALQTNELGRCIALMPAMQYLHQQCDMPLAVFEVGASAGLNLLFDHYSYVYQAQDGSAYQIKSPASSLTLSTEIRGRQRPPVMAGQCPPVCWRKGNELYPLNLSSADDRRWLKALVWPDHQWRVQQCEQALRSVSSVSLDMLGGDLIQALGRIMDDVPVNAMATIVHSFVISQLPDDTVEQFEARLCAWSAERPVARVSFEMLQGTRPKLELFMYCDGVKTSQLLAYADGHGKWIEWLGG